MSVHTRRKRQKQCQQENIEQDAAIFQLPDEIILQIFKKFNIDELILAAGICRKFRQLAFDDELWKCIDLSTRSYSNRVLLKFFRRFPRATAERLKITGLCTATRTRKNFAKPPPFTEQLSSTILSSYPNLRYFHVSRYDFCADPNSVKQIFYFPPKLDGIFLHRCEFPSRTHATPDHFFDIDHPRKKQINPSFSLEQVTIFSFENCSGLTLTMLGHLPELCPNLAELNLNGCHRIESNRILNETLSKFYRTLRRLFLRQTQINDDTIHCICRKLKRLNILDIRSCPNVTADIVDNLHTLKQLKQLLADENIRIPFETT